MPYDQADEYPVDLVEQMKSLGLDGAHRHLNSHLIMAACVERHGTLEQKQRYLPRFATRPHGPVHHRLHDGYHHCRRRAGRAGRHDEERPWPRYRRVTVNLAAHPHYADAIARREHRDALAAVLANPIKLDGVRLPSRPAPALGEHTDELLRDAGLSLAEIAALRAGGAAG